MIPSSSCPPLRQLDQSGLTGHHDGRAVVTPLPGTRSPLALATLRDSASAVTAQTFPITDCLLCRARVSSRLEHSVCRYVEALAPQCGLRSGHTASAPTACPVEGYIFGELPQRTFRAAASRHGLGPVARHTTETSDEQRCHSVCHPCDMDAPSPNDTGR